jgi:hypothetical protein
MSGHKNASGNGAMRNGGTIGSGGIRASISTWVLLLAFNTIVELF